MNVSSGITTRAPDIEGSPRLYRTILGSYTSENGYSEEFVVESHLIKEVQEIVEYWERYSSNARFIRKIVYNIRPHIHELEGNPNE